MLFRWVPNKAKETRLAYGTSSLEHPGVKMVAWERGAYYLGGRLWGFELPKRWVWHRHEHMPLQ